MTDDEKIELCRHYCVGCGHAQGLHPMNGACMACSAVADLHNSDYIDGRSDCTKCGAMVELYPCQKFVAKPEPDPMDLERLECCYHMVGDHDYVCTGQSSDHGRMEKCGCKQSNYSLKAYLEMKKKCSGGCNTCGCGLYQHHPDFHGGIVCHGKKNGKACTCSGFVQIPKEDEEDGG